MTDPQKEVTVVPSPPNPVDESFEFTGDPPQKDIPPKWSLAHAQEAVTELVTKVEGHFRLEKRAANGSIQNVAGTTLEEAVTRANDYDNRTLPTQSGEVHAVPEVAEEDVVVA